MNAWESVSTTPSLAAVLALVVAGAFAPVALAVVLRWKDGAASPRGDGDGGSCDDGSGEHGDGGARPAGCWKKALRRGLHVELGRRPTIRKLFDEALAEKHGSGNANGAPESQTPKDAAHAETNRQMKMLEEMGNGASMPPLQSDSMLAVDGSGCKARLLEIGQTQQRSWSVPIGPGSKTTEAEVRACYCNNLSGGFVRKDQMHFIGESIAGRQMSAHTNSQNSLQAETSKNLDDAERNQFLADRVVFVLRLALGMLASGHCTVDVESAALRIAEVLALPSPRISVGHRMLTAQFGHGPVHLLTCERDFVFSTLADLQSLADALALGEVEVRGTLDSMALLKVLDAIVARPLPYGWIVYDLCFWAIGPWASVAAYYGSYWDMLGAAILSPFTIVTYHLCHRFKISHLECILVPLVLGIMAPLVWTYITNAGQDLCHITPQYMGPLLIWLPGAEICWGTLEVLQGSVVHGASRLVKGLLQAISLATFLVLGWQVFGHNLAEGHLYDVNQNLLPLNESIGAKASLPDSVWCPVPPFGDDPIYPSYFSWPLIVGLYNIPLNILCLMNVFIPLRQCLGPFIVGQVGLLLLAALQFQCTPETCQMPDVIQNGIAAFAATWVAMVVEILQGLPSAISIIPVLFIFAPGSSAVMAVVGHIHVSSGDVFNSNTSSWTDLTMQAFSYGIGIYLGQEVWSGVIAQLNRRKLAQSIDKHASEQRGREPTSKSKYSRMERLLSKGQFREAFHAPQNIHRHGPLSQWDSPSVLSSASDTDSIRRRRTMENSSRSRES